MTKFQRKTREERQEEIREAALEVFMEKGYRNTTMEDVIHKTSLSKGGVYRYYKSCKEILLDLMRKGNDYRLNIIKDLSEKLDDKLEIDEIYVNLIANKIFDEKPYTKLYIMFLSEIIYDEEIKKLFLSIENESFEKIFSMEFKGVDREGMRIFKERHLLISRIINALIFIDELFKEEKVLDNNKDKVLNMIKALVS